MLAGGPPNGRMSAPRAPPWLHPPPGALPVLPYAAHQFASPAHAAYLAPILASGSRLSSTPPPFVPAHAAPTKRPLSPSALQPPASRAASDAAAFCSSIAPPPEPAATAVAVTAATFSSSALALATVSAPATTSAAPATPSVVVTLASTSPGAIVPCTSDHVSLPLLTAQPADTSIASLIGSALPPGLFLPLPAAALSATPSAAFAVPHQTGLRAPAPPIL